MVWSLSEGLRTHMLRHTGMVSQKWEAFLQEITKHVSHFSLKKLNYGCVGLFCFFFFCLFFFFFLFWNFLGFALFCDKLSKMGTFFWKIPTYGYKFFWKITPEHGYEYPPPLGFSTLLLKVPEWITTWLGHCCLGLGLEQSGFLTNAYLVVCV